jgi:hypothetical protein
MNEFVIDGRCSHQRGYPREFTVTLRTVETTRDVERDAPLLRSTIKIIRPQVSTCR